MEIKLKIKIRDCEYEEIHKNVKEIKSYSGNQLVYVCEFGTEVTVNYVEEVSYCN